MKLKVVNVENGDYNKAIKTALIIGAISYGKIYELLHKQIWRKDPNRLLLFNNPLYPTHNGRHVAFIRRWNIKSQYGNPYSYAVPEGADPASTFGLNQLFMEQDPRKWYQGDTGDGIYHDDCYIQPKMQTVPAGEIECWAYYTVEDGSEFGSKTYGSIYRKQDPNGNIIINNVSYGTYSVTVQVPPEKEGDAPTEETHTYRRLIISYANGSTSYVELGEFDEFSPSDGVDFGTVYRFTGTLEQWEQIPSFSEHGAVMYEQVIPNNSLWNMTQQAKAGWIRVYADGTVLEYVPLAIDDMGDGMYYNVPAHYKILPMMYTDSGDLAMDRVEFVEKWNDYFELIVHENGEWWQSFVKPIAAIISLVIAINTGLYFGVDTLMFNVAVAGGITSAIGILSDNTTLSLIGGVLIGYVGLEKMLTDGYMQSLMQSGVFPDRAEILLSNASFTDLFKGFISNAGLENWANIGSNAFSLYNQAQTIGMESVVSVESVAEESGIRATVRNEDEEDEVMRVIRI